MTKQNLRSQAIHNLYTDDIAYRHATCTRRPASDQINHQQICVTCSSSTTVSSIVNLMHTFTTALETYINHEPVHSRPTLKRLKFVHRPLKKLSSYNLLYENKKIVSLLWRNWLESIYQRVFITLEVVVHRLLQDSWHMSFLGRKHYQL